MLIWIICDAHLLETVKYDPPSKVGRSEASDSKHLTRQKLTDMANNKQ